MIRPGISFLPVSLFYTVCSTIFKVNTSDDIEDLLKKLTGFIIKITHLSLLSIVDKTGTKFAKTIFDGID